MTEKEPNNRPKDANNSPNDYLFLGMNSGMNPFKVKIIKMARNLETPINIPAATLPPI